MIEGADTVLTFEPHPLSVIHPEAAPKLIMPFPVKRDVIEGLGVDELVVIGFDREFASTPPEEFCSRILVEQLGAEQVRVGENFRFGAKAKGTPGAARLPRRVRDHRRAAGRGRVGDRLVDPDQGARRGRRRRRGAGVASGAPFMFEGEVVSGDRRGRTLGFPTANIVPDEHYLYPGHGIYAAFANGLPAAVNVGVRPTFESGRGVLIETHIIDHDEDLYGKPLRVAFVERLRGEKRFNGVEELVEQMHRDVEEAREVCATFSRP